MTKYDIVQSSTGDFKDLATAVEAYIVANPTFVAVGSPFFVNAYPSATIGWCQAVCLK